MSNQALISQKTTCPLCLSSARTEIDALLLSLHYPSNPTEDVVNTDTGEVTALAVTKPSFDQTLVQVNALLAKLPSHDTKPFDLNDLIVHTTQHALVREIAGLELRSEGSLLFAGDKVYRKVDPVNFMDWALLLAMQQIGTGEMKLTPTFVINLLNTRWRMTGTSGNDDFVGAMLDKIQNEDVEDDSPVGAEWKRRQAKLAARSAPEPTPDA